MEWRWVGEITKADVNGDIRVGGDGSRMKVERCVECVGRRTEGWKGCIWKGGFEEMMGYDSRAGVRIITVRINVEKAMRNQKRDDDSKPIHRREKKGRGKESRMGKLIVSMYTVILVERKRTNLDSVSTRHCCV